MQKRTFLLGSAVLLMTGCASTQRTGGKFEMTEPCPGKANVYLFQQDGGRLMSAMTLGLGALRNSNIHLTAVQFNDSKRYAVDKGLGNDNYAVLEFDAGPGRLDLHWGRKIYSKEVEFEAGKSYFFTWNPVSSGNVAGPMFTRLSASNARRQLANRVRMY